MYFNLEAEPYDASAHHQSIGVNNKHAIYIKVMHSHALCFKVTKLIYITTHLHFLIEPQINEYKKYKLITNVLIMKQIYRTSACLTLPTKSLIYLKCWIFL